MSGLLFLKKFRERIFVLFFFLRPSGPDASDSQTRLNVGKAQMVT